MRALQVPKLFNRRGPVYDSFTVVPNVHASDGHTLYFRWKALVNARGLAKPHSWARGAGFVRRPVPASLRIAAASLRWYSGPPEELGRVVDLGCWFSVGPTMLASKNGRRLAALTPRDRILYETDGPFGQADGKPLSPWDAERVVSILAELWNEPGQVVSKTLKSDLHPIVF